MIDWTLVIGIVAVLVVLTSIVGFLARREYRKDSVRIAKFLGLRIGFFGGITGTYRAADITIEPGKPIKIKLHYHLSEVAPQMMNINMWILRKGLELPADATRTPASSEDGTLREAPEKLQGLNAIFDREFEVWCSPVEFGQLAFARQQKLGSRLAKSALQHIEVNWLFPGLSCLTNLSIRRVEDKQLQRNLDLVIDLGEHIAQHAEDYLSRGTSNTPASD